MMASQRTQTFSDSESPTHSPNESFNLNAEEVTGSGYPYSLGRTMRQLTLDADAQPDPADLFTILVASDLHLGYCDRDELRKNDSLRTFEEILRTAKENKVDFVLLGGDLFHENKPSRSTAQQCATLLRSYCMGDGGINFELVSEPTVNFGHMEKQFQRINTEDPNLNINLPVYSIHGNHDDPSGSTYLSELDLLHTYGLINYFGKAVDLENIEIAPLLFAKGNTKLAVYGLGAIRDERLHRAYLENQVTMHRPEEATEEWFNIFVIHQNRPAHRGKHNYVPETFLEKWLDLVIWGHEHDPVPVPVLNKEMGFEVLQPGSSVATSMSDGEGKQKYCYLLKVAGRRYRVEPIALETVRPFYIEDINLTAIGYIKDDGNADVIRDDVEKFLNKKMEKLIRKAEEERRPQQPKEPLIRLRVDFGNVEPLNPILFGQRFFGRVANPKEIIQAVKSKPLGRNNRNGDTSNVSQFKSMTIVPEVVTSIEDLLKEHFKRLANDHLQLFSPDFMNESLKQFVHNDDKEAILDAFEFQKAQVEKFLREREIDPASVSDLPESIRAYKEAHVDMPQYLSDFAAWRVNSSKVAKRSPSQATGTAAKRNRTGSDDEDAPHIDNVGPLSLAPLSTQGSVRGRGRGSRARGGATVARGGARGRGRGGAAAAVSPTESEEEEANDSGDSNGPSISSRDRTTTTTRGRVTTTTRGRRRTGHITDYFM